VKITLVLGWGLPAWQWAAIFLVAAAVLARAGISLARAGDELAARTGLGRLLVGMLFVAAATSLPELLTDVSAALAGAPNLAVGDLFGSSMANMAILGVVDLTLRRKMWPLVELGHARLAAVAIGLTALATLGILTPPGVTIGWVGADTVAVAVAYVAAVAWMRRSVTIPRAQRTIAPLPVSTGWGAVEGGSVREAGLRFAAAAVMILVAAPVLAVAGREIATATGMGETFVGTTLMAISTSLPELVASMAALRIGAHDLAVGNLLGSNAVNMAMLVVVDLAYTRGPLLAAVDPSQVVAGVGAILLMALAVAAIVHGEETRIGRLEPDALLLLIAYLGTIWAVWAAQS
jgi:cation:H+ antiporter